MYVYVILMSLVFLSCHGLSSCAFNVCLCHIGVQLSSCLRFGRTLSIHKIHGLLHPTELGAMITWRPRVADTTIAAIFVRFRSA